MRSRTRLATVALCTGYVLSLVIVLSAQSSGQTDAARIGEFNQRVQAYHDLHLRLEGSVPTVKVSSDPAEIRKAIDSLRAAIRAARADARQGDVFSADIAALFRRLIREGCAGDFRALMEVTHEETPPLRHPKVNESWPGEGFTVMPSNLLCSLPALPEELQYRFVNRDLVLWDIHADLIVDFIVDAIPAATTRWR